MFKHFSLKFKMLSAFMLVAMFVLIVAGSGYFSMKKVHKEYDFIAKTVVDNLKIINDMGSKTHEANRHLLLAYMAVSKDQLDPQIAGWKKEVKALEDLDVAYRAVPFQPGEKELHDEFYAAWTAYHKSGEKFLSYFGTFTEESWVNAVIYSEKELNPARSRMNEAFRKLFEYHGANAAEKNATAEDAYALASWLSMGFSVAGIVVAFVVGWFFSNSISNRLNEFSNEIKGSSEKTNTASHELTSASSTLSEGATESAASLEETVSSLEELSSMVKLNSDHAKEANSLSQKSLVSAESGEKEITSLISAMSDMSKSSKKIEEIINVIDDIAFQTNLLALNAAVEAARAGEQGKGFAVVADAVRNLASRSAAAAKDINSLIAENVEKTEEGAKIADKSGVALKEILTSVKKVADLNSEISAASQEQANGIEQISRAMNHLDTAIQSNASSSQEVATSAEEMMAQAETLSALVTDLRKFVSGSKATPKTSQKAPPSSGGSHKKKDFKVVKSHAEPKDPPSKSAAILPFDDEEFKVGKAEGF
ncbi:HAMP domain-containing methyl-accepting chemotaxis protein [Peredibacter starrii]|uniref:Methyl-accepting chemotaxis protein n=1 Tax=Peredibacter starrii TaxID=28202 RepID=A0AAX4HLZ5_9BACT|nr:methyl-accepting chemotaxis protein [Peredibacter starrii]WPU64285.1 methyl-accepting chemotaxis protein [Peredibacter starrii]